MMSLPTARKMVNLKNTADIEAFVAKNSEKDPEIIAQCMAVLFFYGGIPTSMTSILTYKFKCN
jgi:hypothetical protein